MFDSLAEQLPVDIRKLDNSPEAKRLMASLHHNIKEALKDPNSSIGLALNAILVQLTEKGSLVMEEANFTLQERVMISLFVNNLWSKLK